MSRNKTVKGAKPYLFNPRNGRVMVTTQEKLDRLDVHDKPYFIQCDSAKGPAGSPKVHKASVEGSEPVIASTPEADASKVEVKGSADLIDIVNASEDKDELVQIASDLGFKLTKNMNVSTMQGKIAAKLAEMDIT
jgi:hypothetical protein